MKLHYKISQTLYVIVKTFKLFKSNRGIIDRKLSIFNFIIANYRQKYRNTKDKIQNFQDLLFETN